MSQAADTIRPPATLKRDDATAAALKGYKFRSLTDWLLMRKTLQPIALLLCVLALPAGFFLSLNVDASAGVMAFLLISGVMYVIVLQRHAFAMRFESGPLLLDLPRKLPTVTFMFVLFAPAFLFATAHTAHIAISAGAQISRADRAIDLFFNPSLMDERERTETSFGENFYEPLTAETLVRANAQYDLAVQDLHARIERRHAEASKALEGVQSILQWPAYELVNADGTLETIKKILNDNVTALPRPVLGQGFTLGGVTYADCYNQRICDIADQIAFLNIAQSTLGVPRYEGWMVSSNSIASGVSTLPLTWSGFPGLLLVTALALIGAMALRIVRLSQGATPYLLAAIGVFLGMAAYVSACGEWLYRSGYWGDAITSVIFWAVVSTAGIPLALGLIRPLRRDGWGGLVARVFAMATPFLLFMVLLAVEIAGLASRYPQDAPAIQAGFLLTPPLAFALLMWPVWVLFDRAIIRGNCAPKRFA